ncbi:hypothetical protein Zmor_023167 [Zophobas morio]|uniref:Uncharacterized protein n=1 Tax=Zophobas morio TaxID=2755281 RepID=A0AA38M720_9CUCU|nr:hypothetical protein Zmor_023167 [Zophobas morio]
MCGCCAVLQRVFSWRTFSVCFLVLCMFSSTISKIERIRKREILDDTVVSQKPPSPKYNNEIIVTLIAQKKFFLVILIASAIIITIIISPLLTLKDCNRDIVDSVVRVTLT